jgi:hypothetical protein
MAAIDVTVAQQPQFVVKPDVTHDPSFNEAGASLTARA